MRREPIAMLRITDTIAIDEAELEESFILASGPGGQNVNKVATAVQLRFDLRGSPSLPDDVRRRAEARAGSRLTRDGVLVITARRFRSRERNREDARARLAALIEAAAIPPKPRRPTRPTTASKIRRLDTKRKRATIKQARRQPGED
jgi:ribosome-associated protein